MAIQQEVFVRRLIEVNSKIESTCIVCGEKIIASVSDGLPDLEFAHIIKCAFGIDPQLAAA
jgi:hypothetical protein